MGKYPLTPSEKARFERIWFDTIGARKATAILDFDHFCSWLRGEDSSFYYSIKSKLHDLWEEVKSTASDIAAGALKVTSAVVATPIVGIVEGVKEGFENGLDAGVEKAFSSMGQFLDDLFD